MITRLKNIIRHNFMQKLIAVIIASFLWIFVMDDQNPVIEGSYTVPLTVTGVAKNYKAIYTEQPVKIKLRAPRSYFVNYNTADFRAFVNMTNYVEGEFDVSTEAAYPQGFEFVSINPETVHIQLDPFIERQFPVEVIVTGSLAEGRGLKSIQKSQEKVTVVGPKTAVETVKRVIGYAGLSNNQDDFRLQVPMTAINEDGREVRGARVIPTSIDVDIDIETNIRKKTVPVSADIVAADNWEISGVKIEPEQVEISGVEDIINPIESIKNVQQTIPAGSKLFRKNCKLALPEGVTSSVEQISVTVELKKKS